MLLEKRKMVAINSEIAMYAKFFNSVDIELTPAGIFTERC